MSDSLNPQVLIERLGVTFKDPALFLAALTHRSARSQSDYERFEFLGDAVLDLAIAHLLFELHPERQEGDLSKMRAALVNTQALAEVGREIELGSFIRLSKQEVVSGGSERNSTLADVVEAIFGALYQDSGFDAAFQLARNLFEGRVKEVNPTDPKTELQELLHACEKDAPNYRLEFMQGPEHAPEFVSVVEIDGAVMGRGKGPTKKASQQAAALEALQTLRAETLVVKNEDDLKQGEIV